MGCIFTGEDLDRIFSEHARARSELRCFESRRVPPVDGRLLLEEAERVDRVVGSLRSMILFLTLSVLSFLTNLHLRDLYMMVILRFLLFSYAPPLD
ncbi:hypothetical protein GBA52_005855 [Prunus armeniaca]|nr:hypothetical protein GBA52_005855 [Prunus armeniaca]